MHDGDTRKKATALQHWLETVDPLSLVFTSLNEGDFFRRAMEREKRVGRPRPLSVRVAGEELRAGKKSFERMTLGFTLTGRNDEMVSSSGEWKVVEVSGTFVTFEAESLNLEAKDRLQIDAEVGQGEERYCFRILGAVVEQGSANRVTVSLDELNRVRLQTALQKIAKRTQELKDFFKHAKGA